MVRGRKAGIRLGLRMDMKRGGGLALVVCGLGLAGCSSMPGFDSFTPKPTTTPLLVQSNPPGAEARSSGGQTCRTPCTMAIGADSDFTVSLALNGYAPQTITVHSKMVSTGFMAAKAPQLDPDPVSATLEPVAPPPKAPPRQRPRPATAASQVQQ
jgi:hypothetical protein